MLSFSWYVYSQSGGWVSRLELPQFITKQIVKPWLTLLTLLEEKTSISFRQGPSKDFASKIVYDLEQFPVWLNSNFSQNCLSLWIKFVNCGVKLHH